MGGTDGALGAAVGVWGVSATIGGLAKPVGAATAAVGRLRGGGRWCRRPPPAASAPADDRWSRRWLSRHCCCHNAGRRRRALLLASILNGPADRGGGGGGGPVPLVSVLGGPGGCRHGAGEAEEGMLGSVGRLEVRPRYGRSGKSSRSPSQADRGLDKPNGEKRLFARPRPSTFLVERRWAAWCPLLGGVLVLHVCLLRLRPLS